MKVVLRTLFATCICLFLAKNVSSSSLTIVGDVRIETQDNGLLYCDSLICPKGTAQCQVTKRNDPNDFNKIVRHRKCMGQNGDILEEQKLNEPNKYHGSVNVNVTSGGGISGRPFTPEEQKEFDEFMKKTQQNVQDTIQSSLGQFLDGSFAANLQNQIRNSMKIGMNK